MGKLIDADALKEKLIQQRDKVEREKKYGLEWTYNGFNGAVFMVGVEAAKNGIDYTGWIPCAERVPEDTDYVLCTTETKKGIRQVVRGYFMPDLKQWVCGMNSNVIAWMPLPERYRGDESAE